MNKDSISKTSMKEVIKTDVKGQDRLEKTLRKIIKGELAASGHAG